METSARNELNGKISEIVEGTVMTEVRVEVSPSVLMSATVTKEGMQSLGLDLGDTVKVLVKASSIIVSKKKLKATARNNIKCTIAKIIKGAVNSEIKLSLGENTLCAVVTKEAVEDLNMSESNEAYALFKASSVILVA